MDQLKDQFATFSVRAPPTPARRHYVDKSFRESLDKPFDKADGKADGKAGGKAGGKPGGKPDGKGDANPVEKSSSKVNLFKKAPIQLYRFSKIALLQNIPLDP